MAQKLEVLPSLGGERPSSVSDSAVNEWIVKVEFCQRSLQLNHFKYLQL